MSVVSARRYGAVVAVNVLIGIVGVVLPSLTHASTPPPLADRPHASQQPSTTPSAPRTMQRRVEHTRTELVRNGGFHHGRAHWVVGGRARPRLRIVNPGMHSRHAARLAWSGRGIAVLAERLSIRRSVKGDRYRASAMVKRVGDRRTRLVLRVNEMSGGRIVGHERHRIVLRHRGWQRVSIRYHARRSGSGLVLRLAAPSRRHKHRVDVDNVKVVETRTVRFVPVTPTPPVTTPTPGPTSSPTPEPTQTVPAPITSPPSSCSVSALLVPSCGAWWGVYKPPSAGENWQSTYTDLESAAGRPFNILYRYQDMSNSSGSGQFPDANERALGATHILMFSWASRVFSSNTQLAWSDIAAGKYDSSVIDPEAARLKAYGKPVFVTFDPEMDRRMPAAGTAADYVAAYRHIHNEFAADGVTNVVWVWTVTGYSARDSVFPTLYPGNSYVDWIGYDPYNFASCHSTGWRSFDQTIDPFYQWLETNGYGDKPFMLPEYGTVADPSDPSASGAWYAAVPAGIASHPNIKAVVEWDDVSAPCNTELTVDPGTMGGFSSAGSSSVFTQAPGAP